MATASILTADRISAWTDEVAAGVALFWGCRPDQIVLEKCGIYLVCHCCARRGYMGEVDEVIRSYRRWEMAVGHSCDSFRWKHEGTGSEENAGEQPGQRSNCLLDL